MKRTIAIRNQAGHDPVFANIERVLKRKLRERHPDAEFVDSGQEVTIALSIDRTIGREGFRLSAQAGVFRIEGSDALGVLSGAGKLLRSLRADLGSLSWSGTSVPDKELRGIYFATHFYNYYHMAPVAEIREYVEEIALWGINTIAVWFDMHHYRGIDDPKAVEFIGRLKEILKAAKAIGVRVALFSLGNEAYADSPEHLRADWRATDDGRYPEGLGSHYHVELCPSKPEAVALMNRWKRELYEAFGGIGVDFVGFFPYDQGGCTCEACSPYGGNGFIRICRESARVARECMPGVKVIISTWLFEYFTTGEWERLAASLAGEKWADYIQWDYNTTGRGGTGFILDPYLAEHGSPGGLPIVGFPEISMFATRPYGGWGANPQIPYLVELWRNTGELFRGGFPYSEGKYEDLNKVICAQLYWDRHRSVRDIVLEYLRYEVSDAVPDELYDAIVLMQETYVRRAVDRNGNSFPRTTPYRSDARFAIKDPAHVQTIYETFRRVHALLDERAKRSWRWRVLLLRAEIDHELLENDFAVSERCEAALGELEAMYHAQEAATSVRPQTREARSVYKEQ